MKPSPRERYQHDLSEPGFVRDEAQAAAVDALQRVYEQLIDTPPKKRLSTGNPRWTPVRGLYLWGGVGRGKTYLMDCFYEALPFSRKRRTHFHRFMEDVHQRNKAYARRKDPLKHVAADLASEARVLCFDEFFVSDIADAMILARLTDQLFAAGITLVATSNIEPAGLYQDGLQRERFLPAIEMIEANTEILRVDGGEDYRLRVLEQAEIYHHPLDTAADENLDRYFTEIAPEIGERDTAIAINGRDIPARRLADGVLWSDFAGLCEGPRGAADYVEIARCFGTVLLSNVPQMTWESENEARRFITLVDEFYDRNVKLILSAAEPPESLYIGEKLAFEFERTRSRLQEMQSHDYLAQPHLP